VVEQPHVGGDRVGVVDGAGDERVH
jgi:hypothetical protein